MNQPLVTVLMSVYNAEQYLRKAIDSILQQTFTDFEFLIINDASTDTSLEIIKSYKNDRVRLVNNLENLKLTKSLNKGIGLAGGKYIARMDADDISLPERLEKQVRFMEENPRVGLCGTFIRTLGLPEDYDIAFRTTHDEIKFKLFFDTHFPHPAAMIRKSVLDEHALQFDASNPCAQDYELWNKMTEFCELAIIPEILVLKRAHEGQISVKQTDLQKSVVKKIHSSLVRKLGLSPTENQMNLYEAFLEGKLPDDLSDMFILLDFMDALVKGNDEFGIYKQELFNKHFAQVYWDICTTSTHLGPKLYQKYRQSYSRRYLGQSFLNKEKFLLKSLLHYKYD